MTLSRKLNRVQKFKKVKSEVTSDANKLDTQFMPVPYNLNIELYESMDKTIRRCLTDS